MGREREKESAFHWPCSLILLLPAWHIFNKGTDCLYIHTLLFSLYGQSLIHNQQARLSDALNILNTRGQPRYPWLVHKHAERGLCLTHFWKTGAAALFIHFNLTCLANVTRQPVPSNNPQYPLFCCGHKQRHGW